MTHKNIKYFNYARNMAMMSDYNRVHIGCVAVMNNKILSTGFNTTKSHPLQAHYNQFRDFHGAEMHNYTLHAEMSCLIPLWSSNLAWNKIKLYIYRIKCGTGKGLSRPCNGCMAAIKDLGIKEIYYTTDTGYVKEIIE